MMEIPDTPMQTLYIYYFVVLQQPNAAGQQIFYFKNKSKKIYSIFDPFLRIFDKSLKIPVLNIYFKY